MNLTIFQYDALYFQNLHYKSVSLENAVQIVNIIDEIMSMKSYGKSIY